MPSFARWGGLSPLNITLLVGLAVLLFQLLGPVLTIQLRIPINYNEGWNAIFDSRAVTPGAGPLYPPPDSFVFNNYPPLGFYIVGAMGRFVFGDMIVAGRVVALLSLVGAAGLLACCVRGLGGGWRGAAAAGLLLLLFINSYYKAYVAVDDPQWLAHFMMLGGLSVLLCGGGFERLRRGELPLTRLAAGALLIVAGGFVKHNLVALPVALTIWLCWLNRRAAAAWIVALAVAVAVGVGVTAALHGWPAFDDVLAHRRVFRAILMKHAISDLEPMAPMAVVAVALLGLMWRRDRQGARAGVVLIALFAVIAVATGIGQRWGEGVYYNAQFETLIAACLGFGVAWSPIVAAPAAWRGRSIGAAALLCVAASPLIGAWPWHLPRAWEDISKRGARVAEWRPVITAIAAAGGPVGCQMMSLCWWAGRPSEIDMFNLSEKSVLAGGAPAAFRDAVSGHHFAMIQDDVKSFIHRDASLHLGFDPVMSVVARDYATVEHGPGAVVLLAPERRGAQAAVAAAPAIDPSASRP